MGANSGLTELLCRFDREALADPSVLQRPLTPAEHQRYVGLADYVAKLLQRVSAGEPTVDAYADFRDLTVGGDHGKGVARIKAEVSSRAPEQPVCGAILAELYLCPPNALRPDPRDPYTTKVLGSAALHPDAQREELTREALAAAELLHFAVSEGVLQRADSAA